MAVPKKGLLQTHYTMAVTYSQNRLHIVAVIKTATRKTVSIAWFFCSDGYLEVPRIDGIVNSRCMHIGVGFGIDEYFIFGYRVYN